MSTNTPRPSIFTDEMIEAAERLLQATAMEQVLEPVVNGYKKDILDRLQLPPAPEHRDNTDKDVIDDPDQVYLLSEADLHRYLAEVNAARIAARLHVDDPESCPLLVATAERVRAENDLIAALAKIPRLKDLEHFSAARLTDRKEVLDHALSMLAPYVKPAASAISDLIAKGSSETTK